MSCSSLCPSLAFRIELLSKIQVYPESIPFFVYNYRLEQDPIKKKEQLAELKEKYSKHWMVKDI